MRSVLASRPMRVTRSAFSLVRLPTLLRRTPAARAETPEVLSIASRISLMCASSEGLALLSPPKVV